MVDRQEDSRGWDDNPNSDDSNNRQNHQDHRDEPHYSGQPPKYRRPYGQRRIYPGH